MPNLLFDYDGTLHDSMKIYAPSVQVLGKVVALFRQF